MGQRKTKTSPLLRAWLQKTPCDMKSSNTDCMFFYDCRCEGEENFFKQHVRNGENSWHWSGQVRPSVARKLVDWNTETTLQKVATRSLHFLPCFHCDNLWWQTQPPGAHWCEQRLLLLPFHSLHVFYSFRRTIMDEIVNVMSNHGMSIDVRHVMLLADLMCFKVRLFLVYLPSILWLQQRKTCTLPWKLFVIFRVKCWASRVLVWPKWRRAFWCWHRSVHTSFPVFCGTFLSLPQLVPNKCPLLFGFFCLSEIHPHFHQHCLKLLFPVWKDCWSSVWSVVSWTEGCYFRQVFLFINYHRNISFAPSPVRVRTLLFFANNGTWIVLSLQAWASALSWEYPWVLELVFSSCCTSILFIT